MSKTIMSIPYPYDAVIQRILDLTFPDIDYLPTRFLQLNPFAMVTFFVQVEL
jgi:hypothetical protein